MTANHKLAHVPRVRDAPGVVMGQADVTEEKA